MGGLDSAGVAVILSAPGDGWSFSGGVLEEGIDWRGVRRMCWAQDSGRARGRPTSEAIWRSGYRGAGYPLLVLQSTWALVPDESGPVAFWFVEPAPCEERSFLGALVGGHADGDPLL